MKRNITAIIMSLLAAICFFLAYLFGKQTINLILGGIWSCIGIMNLVIVVNKSK